MTLTHSSHMSEPDPPTLFWLWSAEMLREIPKFIDGLEVLILWASLPYPFRGRWREARNSARFWNRETENPRKAPTLGWPNAERSAARSLAVKV
jgi:hypothetical protein